MKKGFQEHLLSIVAFLLVLFLVSKRIAIIYLVILLVLLAKRDENDSS